MRFLLKKLYAIGVSKEQVRKMTKNTVEITRERGRLILSKGDAGKFNIISILEGKTDREVPEEEVLKFIEEYK